MSKANPAVASTRQAITTTDLKRSMSSRWGAPEWAIAWEVSDSTGGGKTRTVDALMMSLWPSRGIELHGVEIKVHRSDWLKELRSPNKAEAIACFCDRFWLHAAPGVLKEGELPSGWGLRTFNGDTWKTEKEAPVLQPRPIDRSFLAAIMRRNDVDLRREAEALAEEKIAAARAAIEQTVEARVRRRTADTAQILAMYEAFSSETGIRIEDMAGHGEIEQAARIMAALLRTGVAAQWGGLSALQATLSSTLGKVEEAMAMVGVEPMSALVAKPRARTRK